MDYFLKICLESLLFYSLAFETLVFLYGLFFEINIFKIGKDKRQSDTSKVKPPVVTQVPDRQRKNLPKSNSNNTVLPRFFKTKMGENVYSRGEKEIADFLRLSRIPYEYEPQKKVGFRTIKPDFYLPKFDVYIEYLGMWEDSQAQHSYRKKMALYYNSNKKVIFLYPSQRGRLGEMIKWYSERDRIRIK